MGNGISNITQSVWRTDYMTAEQLQDFLVGLLQKNKVVQSITPAERKFTRDGKSSVETSKYVVVVYDKFGMTNENMG